MAISRHGEMRTAAINATGAGTHNIVAAVTSYRIVIHKMFLTASAETDVTILDSAGTTIAGAFPIGENGGFLWPCDGREWGHTAAGRALQITLSAAATVGGIVGYTVEE